MAKFVITNEDGRFETALEGEYGEEVSAEMASAYALMLVGHSLARIADALGSIGADLERLADNAEAG